jgi:cytochrome P450
VTLEAERPHGVAPSVDVTAAELERDPYPFLARLRAEAPVVFVPALGMWLLTRFEDVKRAHADAERFFVLCGRPHSTNWADLVAMPTGCGGRWRGRASRADERSERRHSYPRLSR